MSIEKILVVDPDRLMRDFVSDILLQKHLDVVTAEDGTKAFEILETVSVDLIITSLRMPGITGIDLLCKVKELYPGTLVVIMTALDSEESSAEAMRLGAVNYLIKPLSVDVIDAVLEKARQHISLVEENKYLRHQVSTGGSRSLPQVIAVSPSMKQILSDAIQVAKSHATVLISGESGTGKEVIAHTIHFNSERAQCPFIKVNCAAMPETLIESEFFGHEKGAFTGANAKRLGRFELAHGGSLLLDEITEIPPALQAKLLRAVQEQEFERLGGTKAVKVDVRLISTSNRDVKQAVADKILREDLYYRLNVVPIVLPPLRDRPEDIVPLADYFLERMCLDNKKQKRELTPSAKKKLLGYAWPGNIRELANIIERAVVLDAASEIKAEHLHLEDGHLQGISQTGTAAMPVGITLRELEKRLIIETLQQQQNDRTKAAEILGISPRVLRNKMNAYNL